MFRRSFIAAVTLIFTLILTQPAQAQTQSPSPSADPQEGRVPPRIALVLDTSGSMAETDVDGGTRMDAAKDAATGMVEDLDDDVELGLIAYGSEVDDSEPSNIEEGCEDITVLRSVGPLDREATTEEIDGLEATGYTPIGNSLRTAADELGDDGPRSIVLVSDGIDTCAPPAVCDVAEDLAEGGVDLTIHTVGFKVDDDAQGELECIAEATGGTYSSADDSDELGSTLSALAQRVGQSYEAGGTEITLAEERSDGQFLGEGAYQTELPGPTTGGGDGEAGWFKLNIPEGYRALVSATVVSPSMDDVAQALDDDQRYFSVNVRGENASCNMTTSSRYDSTTFGREAPAASVMQIRPDDDCPADEWNLSLHRQGSDYTDELPVEILIGLEPIPEEGEQGPAADDFDRDDADLSALTEDYDVTDLDGGTSYGTAPEVEPGTYSGSLVPGETRFYKLPMDWGERPVAEATFNARNADDTRRFKVEVATPMRQNTGVVMSTSLNSGSEVTQRHEDAYWPVYDYRNGGLRYEREAAYAGDWYVMVTLSGGSDTGRASVEEDYELTVVREGESIDGPDWTVPSDDGPAPSADPILPLTGPAAADGSTTTDGASPGSSADASATDSDEAAQAQDSTQAGFLGLSLPVTIGIAAALGLVVLVGAGVLVAVLTRRNRNP